MDGVDRLPQGRMIFLDAIRGLAALAVVGFHLAWVTPLREPLAEILPGPVMAVLGASHAGVAVFFALSGFVIARSLSRATVDLRYFGRFALRRSLRLDPPYWCAVLLAAALLALASVAMVGAPAPPTAASVLAHLAYLQDILGMPPLALQFWTLPYELQFYLVACGCLGLAQLLRRRLPDPWPAWILHAPLAVVSFALAMKGISTSGWFLDLWYQFALGALTCRMLEGRASRVIWGACILVAVGGAIATSSARVAMMTATCVIIVVASGAGALARWGSAGPLQWLGRISYSLYLTHFVGTWALIAFARSLRPGPVASLGLFGAGLILSLLLAWVFHRLVEAPSLALSRSPRPVADLAAGLRRLRSRLIRGS